MNAEEINRIIEQKEPEDVEEYNLALERTNAFNNFPENVFDEEFEKRSVKYSISKDDNAVKVYNDFVSAAESALKQTFAAMGQRIHEKIRKEGIPIYWPSDEYSIYYGEFHKISKEPFSTRKVGFRIGYFNGNLPRMKGTDAAAIPPHEILEDEDVTVVRTKKVRRHWYMPSSSTLYDEEYKSLLKQQSDLRNKIKECDEAMKKAEESAELYKGSMGSGFVGAIFKLLAAVGFTALISAIPAFIIMLVFVKMHLPDLIGLILIGVIVVGVFIYQLGEWNVTGFIFDEKFRKEAAADMSRIQNEIAQLNKQITDIGESAAFKAAKARNQAAYDADCKLAETWQDAWYESVIG